MQEIKCETCDFNIRDLDGKCRDCQEPAFPHWQPKSAPGKDAANCQKCINCQKMRDVTNNEISWRCYGSDNVGELKRDICVAEQPPIIAPDFCPNRKREKPAPVKSAAVPVLLGETVMTDEQVTWSSITNPELATIRLADRRVQDAHTRGKISKALKEIMNNTPLNDTRELLNKISSLIVKLEGK